MSKENSHTSTLFHFTKNQKTLFCILKEGLKASYCGEHFAKDIFAGIPMVSFCDIPLTRCKEHRDKYGKYAIGFSKEAFSNKEDFNFTLGPLGYFNENQKNLISTISSMAKAKNKAIGWFKPYENAETNKNSHSIYYDECEWRLLSTNTSWFWEVDNFEKWENARKDRFLNNGNCKIGFDAKYIKYILVYQEQNIKSTVERLLKLKTLGGRDITDKEKHLLISKVISFDSISQDF